MRSVLLLLTSVLMSGEAAALQFGLYTDTECSSCNLTLANGETKTIYLNAFMELDPLSCFDPLFYGVPAGWGAVAMPSPIVTQAEDPTAGPATICVGLFVPSECVTVYSIQLTATTTESDVLLTVAGPSGPTSCIPYYPECFMCEPLCVVRDTMTVNGEGDCLKLALQADTWSAVKKLFSTTD